MRAIRSFAVFLVLLVAMTGGVWAMQRSTRPGATGDLKIVVIAGEDAVNIVQQKTAVAPIVEVRDRNDVPVAGVAVTFAIQGGKTAAFGGASTLTVATNAAGQAVATGFSPLAAGAVQVNVQAAFQGQIAVATLTQTNVMTAAQAAALSAGSASGTSTGAAAGGGSSSTGASAGAGTAAGGGGGLSATTLGIVGAAAAGGAVVAVKAVGGGAAPATYSGPFAFDWQVGCLLERMTGTLTLEIESSSEAPEAVVSSGNLRVQNGSSAVVSRPANCAVQGAGNWGMPDAAVTGMLNNLTAHGQDTVPSQVGGTLDRSYDFRGGLSGGVITGTFEMTWGGNAPQFPRSSGTGPITLSRAQ